MKKKIMNFSPEKTNNIILTLVIAFFALTSWGQIYSWDFFTDKIYFIIFGAYWVITAALFVYSLVKKKEPVGAKCFVAATFLFMLPTVVTATIFLLIIVNMFFYF